MRVSGAFPTSDETVQRDAGNRTINMLRMLFSLFSHTQQDANTQD
jgi:hypothetical protein